MAEREGFEPSIGVTYTHFPGVRLRPLGHLSCFHKVWRQPTQPHLTPEAAVTVAPFQAWRSSQHIAARGPRWVTIERRIVAELGGDSYSRRGCWRAHFEFVKILGRSRYFLGDG